MSDDDVVGLLQDRVVYFVDCEGVDIDDNVPILHLEPSDPQPAKTDALEIKFFCLDRDIFALFCDCVLILILFFPWISTSKIHQEIRR